MAKKAPSNEMDAGLFLGREPRSHVPWGNQVHMPQRQRSHAVETVLLNKRRPCIGTREKLLRVATRESRRAATKTPCNQKQKKIIRGSRPLGALLKAGYSTSYQES